MSVNSSADRPESGDTLRRVVIVDIGCRWGFAERFIRDGASFQVYGFDPDEEECERLRHLYRGQAVEVIPKALSGRSGPRTLYLTREPACSSLLPPDPALTEIYPALGCARQVATTTIETTTLDEWSREHGVPVIDYLKLDTQGTELEILQGGVAALVNVRCLELEVEFNPIYLGQPVFSDVDQFLRGQGFVLWKLSNHVHYSRDGSPGEPMGQDAIFYDDMQRIDHPTCGGQLYWANAHYVRKEMLLAGSQSGAQARRDALLLEAIGIADVSQESAQQGAERFPGYEDPARQTSARIDVLSGGIDRATRAVALSLLVTNTGETRWENRGSSAHRVTVALRQGVPGTSQFRECCPRHALAAALLPGESVRMAVRFTLPADATFEDWELDLVTEGAFWFSIRRQVPSTPISCLSRAQFEAEQKGHAANARSGGAFAQLEVLTAHLKAYERRVILAETREAETAARCDAIEAQSASVGARAAALSTRMTSLEAQILELQERLMDAETRATDNGTCAAEAQSLSRMLSARLLEASTGREAAEAHVDALLGSTSWRMTSPLRSGVEKARRVPSTLRRGAMAFFRRVAGFASEPPVDAASSGFDLGEANEAPQTVIAAPVAEPSPVDSVDVKGPGSATVEAAAYAAPHPDEAGAPPSDMADRSPDPSHLSARTHSIYRELDDALRKRAANKS